MTSILKHVRVFRQGYEEVYQLGNQTVTMVVTDLDKFNKYGVTQTTVDELKQLMQSVGSDFDALHLLEQKHATLQKDAMVSEVTETLYDLEMQLNLMFDKSSLTYKAFGLNSISTLNDNGIASKAILCYNLLNSKYAHILNAEIDQDFIDLLHDKGQSLRLLIDSQSFMEKERHLATQERVNNANTLYEKISKIRRIGVKMWASTDYVKSNAYKMPTQRTYSSNSSEQSDDDDFIASTDGDLNNSNS
jgi:hypothetical protein